jgi:hypothetical protein
MHRIFPILVAFALVFLTATLAIGLLIDLREPLDAAAAQWFTLHFLAGLASSLVVMLVDGIVVTYFIGTSRWCKEVVETYALDAQLARRSAIVKRRAFPITLAHMLAMVSVVALGAAGDPAVGMNPPPTGVMTWGDIHFVAALCFMGFTAYAAYFQWLQIRSNQQVIGDIMDQVRQIRVARGLETSPAA